jgi:phytoene dehydrogenase-like protein
MTYDVIVIGAGIGGLSCAAKLAKSGKKVLALEKNRHIGGTSYIFRRKGYSFPMGPLGFSFPGRVKTFLSEVGAKSPLDFKRNHFQLITPSLDIIYSLPFKDIKGELKKYFPAEHAGLDAFFSELENLISLTGDIYLWHPDYQLENEKKEQKIKDEAYQQKLDRSNQMSQTPCREMLERYFSDQRLIKFLGSQGTSEPEMSLLNLAFMWNVMSREGIWFPSCGIHGLNDMLANIVLNSGGEIKLGTPAEEIIIKEGKAVGVKSADGESYFSDCVVSNADYKRTFLELIRPQDIPHNFRDIIIRVPYTGSELCVYLGLDPRAVDLSRMKANHVFYQHNDQADAENPNPLEDFENREFEICLWSDQAPNLVPQGKAAAVLRISFPYDHFSNFRTGEKKRREDYRASKMRLTHKLIKAAENLLPGLSSACEVIESATPLTYQDWGQRYRGSIAGWTWSADYEKVFGKKLLVETPIRNLFMVGIYAASELFLGGVATAIHTADLAAEIILS